MAKFGPPARFGRTLLAPSDAPSAMTTSPSYVSPSISMTPNPNQPTVHGLLRVLIIPRGAGTRPPAGMSRSAKRHFLARRRCATIGPKTSDRCALAGPRKTDNASLQRVGHMRGDDANDCRRPCGACPLGVLVDAAHCLDCRRLVTWSGSVACVAGAPLNRARRSRRWSAHGQDERAGTGLRRSQPRHRVRSPRYPSATTS